MFKKMLSSIGIGSATVDLVLDRKDCANLIKDNAYKMGDVAKGVIYIKGGTVEQEIKEIKVDLRVHSLYQKDDSAVFFEKTVAQEFLTDSFILKPNETKEFEFDMKIPKGLAVSSINTKYYFVTNLGIESAIDPTDKDVIEILPSDILANFYDAFKQLGFIPKKEGFNGRVQSVDFRPTAWLKGQLDELVFEYVTSNTHKEVAGHFEIDKKTKGLAGALMDELDLDEKKGRFSFSKYELENKEIALRTVKKFIETRFRDIL